jgi:molybdate transport system substrate-binding protein
MRVLIALIAALTAVGPTAAQPASPLTVFAASDLALAFQEIVPRFEKATGSSVTLVLGSSGNFAQQIENGAPADVFFSADVGFIDRLVQRGFIIPQTRAVYGQGRIVLATAKSAGPKLTDLRQLLDQRVRHVSIANPVHAPYGKAAEQALRAVGLWDSVKAKLVYAENIRQALQYIQTGAVEAGIVALAIAGVPEIEWVAIDPTLHAPLNQAAGVLRRSGRPELGTALVQFVNGAEGRPIMKRFGFMLPGEF